MLEETEAVADVEDSSRIEVRGATPVVSTACMARTKWSCVWRVCNRADSSWGFEGGGREERRRRWWRVLGVISSVVLWDEGEDVEEEEGRRERADQVGAAKTFWKDGDSGGCDEFEELERWFVCEMQRICVFRYVVLADFAGEMAICGELPQTRLVRRRIDDILDVCLSSFLLLLNSVERSWRP